MIKYFNPKTITSLIDNHGSATALTLGVGGKVMEKGAIPKVRTIWGG